VEITVPIVSEYILSLGMLIACRCMYTGFDVGREMRQEVRRRRSISSAAKRFAFFLPVYITCMCTFICSNECEGMSVQACACVCILYAYVCVQVRERARVRMRATEQNKIRDRDRDKDRDRDIDRATAKARARIEKKQ